MTSKWSEITGKMKKGLLREPIAEKKARLWGTAMGAHTNSQ